MELCNSQALLSNSSNHRLFNPISHHFELRSHLPLKPTVVSFTKLGLHQRSGIAVRAGTTEEASKSTSLHGEDQDPLISVGDDVPVEKILETESFDGDSPSERSPTEMGGFEFLNDFNAKVESEGAYVYLIYGSGALVSLWLASAVVGAIDSIPVVPKMMELVGLSYSIWFSIRYLLFKRNRDELRSKIDELKQRVLGLDD